VQDAWTDSFTADFGWVTAQFGQAYTADQIRRMAKAAGESVSLFNQKQLDRSIGSVLELDAVASEPWLAEKLGEFVVENTNLITSLEDTALSQVQTMAMQGLTQGRRWEDIADDIYGRFDVARSRADTIARDQVGKLNGQLTELRQQNLGISQYTWRGVGDERERESHRANNDQVFDWDSPPEETGHPGDDINCRCYAEPVIESIDTEG
jgi:SPP1 gp7 family putative phage head morphogenesis protein